MARKEKREPTPEAALSAFKQATQDCAEQVWNKLFADDSKNSVVLGLADLFGQKGEDKKVQILATGYEGNGAMIEVGVDVPSGGNRFRFEVGPTMFTGHYIFESSLLVGVANVSRREKQLRTDIQVPFLSVLGQNPSIGGMTHLIPLPNEVVKKAAQDFVRATNFLGSIASK